MYSPSLINLPIKLFLFPVVLLEAVIIFPLAVNISFLFVTSTILLGLLRWPDVTLFPPAPSPVPTDTSSMVEGLLHPRLGMALGSSQEASATSIRDHEDYTRPINGVCFFLNFAIFFRLIN